MVVVVAGLLMYIALQIIIPNVLLNAMESKHVGRLYSQAMVLCHVWEQIHVGVLNFRLHYLIRI